MTLAEWHVVIEAFIKSRTPEADSGITDDELTRVLAEEMAAGRA